MKDFLEGLVQRLDRAERDPDIGVEEVHAVMKDLIDFLGDDSKRKKAYDRCLGHIIHINHRVELFMDRRNRLRDAAGGDEELLDAYRKATNKTPEEKKWSFARPDALGREAFDARLERALICASKRHDVVPLRIALPQLAKLLHPNQDQARLRRLLTKVAGYIQPPKRPRGRPPRDQRPVVRAERSVENAANLGGRMRRKLSDEKHEDADVFAMRLHGIAVSTRPGDKRNQPILNERNNRIRRKGVH